MTGEAKRGKTKMLNDQLVISNVTGPFREPRSRCFHTTTPFNGRPGRRPMQFA